MLIIRLRRVGKKHDSSFRIILIDWRRSAKSGSYLEMLGSYNPGHGKPQLKSERILYWISKGAKVSGTVNNLLVSAGVIRGPKVNVSPSLKKSKKSEKKPKEEKLQKEKKPQEEKLSQP